MIKTLTRSAMIALLLPAIGAAIAQTPPPPSAPAPEDQGSMTLAQFQAHQEQRIMAADTDGDGRVSLAEWTARASGRRGGGAGAGGYDPARAFARMDSNHDGFIDKAEIDAVSAERFRRMDSNGDGVVTPDERMAERGGMRNRRGAAPSDGQPMPLPPPPSPQP